MRREVRKSSDPLTRLAPAGENAGGEPPSPQGGEGRRGFILASNF